MTKTFRYKETRRSDNSQTTPQPPTTNAWTERRSNPVRPAGGHSNVCVCGGGGGALKFSPPARDVTAENVVLAGSRFVHPSIDLYIELILVYVSSIMPPFPYVCKIVYVMV